jgi:hypothetical protein
MIMNSGMHRTVHYRSISDEETLDLTALVVMKAYVPAAHSSTSTRKTNRGKRQSAVSPVNVQSMARRDVQPTKRGCAAHVGKMRENNKETRHDMRRSTPQRVWENKR